MGSGGERKTDNQQNWQAESHEVEPENFRFVIPVNSREQTFDREAGSTSTGRRPHKRAVGSRVMLNAYRLQLPEFFRLLLADIF